jgi:hypothetical protein
MKFSTLAVFVACAVGRGEAFSATASFKPSFGVQVRLFFGILIFPIARKMMAVAYEDAPQLACSKVWQQSPTAKRLAFGHRLLRSFG